MQGVPGTSAKPGHLYIKKLNKFIQSGRFMYFYILFSHDLSDISQIGCTISGSSQINLGVLKKVYLKI
jgi:hypothetical protein